MTEPVTPPPADREDATTNLDGFSRPTAAGCAAASPAPRQRTAALAVTLAFLLVSVFLAACPSTPNPKFRHENLPQDLGPDKGAAGLATKESLLTGPRSRGRVGDWVLRNDRIVAIFRRQDGKLVDLGFRDQRKDLFAGLTNTVSDTRGTYAVLYDQAKVVSLPPNGSLPQNKDGRNQVARKRKPVQGLEFFGRVRDRDLNLEVRTKVWAIPDKPVLVLRTTVRNASRQKVVRLGIGDRTYFGNEPIFVPGHGMVTRSVRVHASWAAQEGQGRTLALVSASPRPMALRFRVYSKGFNPGVAATYGYANLQRNDRFTVTRYLIMHPGGLAEAGSLIQSLLGGTVCRTSVTKPTIKAIPAVPVRLQMEREGRPLLDAQFTKESQGIVLAAGPPARARLWVAGAGPGSWTKVRCNGKTTPPLPAIGVLQYRVTDAETKALLPGRLLVRGIDGTGDPDFGARDRLSGTANQAYSISGKGALLLKPGKYLVAALHGPEYSWDVRKVEIASGAAQDITFQIAHLVDTHAAVSADLHLHAAPSSDSELSLATRLAQLAATGVEVAVATDHNAVTDYRPALRASGLQGRLFVLPGVEATTKRSLLGHFNVFPLTAGSEPPPYENKTAKEFFSAWHGLKSHPIVQVNHPRLTYLGYFNQMDFDPHLGKAFAPDFADDFEALEVFNGTRMHNPKRIEDVLADWFTLLNLGKKITGTGNSDSHKLVYQEAGYPRNYLLTGVDNPTEMTQQALKKALLEHRVVVGSGPYLTLTKDQSSIVGTQQSSPVEALFTLQAPCWLTVDRLALVANGRVVQRWTLTGNEARTTCSGDCSLPASPWGQPAGGKRETTEDGHAAGIGLGHPSPRKMAPGVCRAQKLTIPLTLAPKRDTWFLLLAWSTKDNPTMPIPGGLVLSFTNPVWVDADGDGKFTPPPRPGYPLR